MRLAFKPWDGDSERYDWELQIYDAPNHPYRYYHNILLTDMEARRLFIDMASEMDVESFIPEDA